MNNEFISQLRDWAVNDEHIDSLILVGSYARGTHKDTSDIDLCVITQNKADMLQNQAFVEHFGEAVKTQTEQYGACTSVRVWYENGQEVEFGLVEPSWISLPLDTGTHRVLSDGYLVIVDKKHYFDCLVI